MSENARSVVGELELSNTINVRYGAKEGGGLILDEETNEFRVVLTDLSNVFLQDLSDHIMTPIDPGCSAVGETFMAKGLSSATYSPGTIVAGYGCEAGTRAYRIVSADSDDKTFTLTDVGGISAGTTFSFKLYHNYDLVGTVDYVDP